MSAQRLVEDVMTPAPVRLEAECTLAGALTFLVRHRYQTAPVVDPRGRIAGLVTRGGLLARLCQLSSVDDPLRLRELMMAPVTTMIEPALEVACGTTLVETCKLLIRAEAPAALVQRDGQLVGILTLQDVVRWVAYGAGPDPASDLPAAFVVRDRLDDLAPDGPWAPPP